MNRGNHTLTTSALGGPARAPSVAGPGVVAGPRLLEHAQRRGLVRVQAQGRLRRRAWRAAGALPQQQVSATWAWKGAGRLELDGLLELLDALPDPVGVLGQGSGPAPRDSARRRA